MPTLRIAGGRVEHVVHETETQSSKGTGFVICRPDKLVGEITASGSVTCKKCIALDIPIDLLPPEKSALRVVAEGGPFNGRLAGIGQLIRLDYVNQNRELTRRGWLVAKDFTEGAAPWRDDAGIVHGRAPLSVTSLCSPAAIFAALGKLTTERYGKLRLVSDPITCLACARLAR